MDFTSGLIFLSWHKWKLFHTLGLQSNLFNLNKQCNCLVKSHKYTEKIEYHTCTSDYWLRIQNLGKKSEETRKWQIKITLLFF